MYIVGVYTLPIFIACPYTSYRVVYTPHNEYWRSVHPHNIHRVPHIPPVEGSIPLLMNVGGVYTLPMFIVCRYFHCQVVYTPPNIPRMYTLPIFITCPYACM